MPVGLQLQAIQLDPLKALLAQLRLLRAACRLGKQLQGAARGSGEHNPCHQYFHQLHQPSSLTPDEPSQ